MRILLISIITFVSLQAAQFEANLTKGGEYRCYKSGDVLLCFKSLCANALFEEVRGETTTKQRKALCAQENKNANFTGKAVLRSLTNANFVRDFEGVIP